MSTELRPHMGDFNSIVCFKAVVVGMEKTLGPQAALVGLLAAGRARGDEVVTSLGLKGRGIRDGEAIRAALDAALGKDGTRLCGVERVEFSGDTVRVALSETVCSAGEPQGSPRTLSFTMGAVQGAIEGVTGLKLKGKQVESVLRGGQYDVIEFAPRV